MPVNSSDEIQGDGVSTDEDHPDTSVLLWCHRKRDLMMWEKDPMLIALRRNAQDVSEGLSSLSQSSMAMYMRFTHHAFTLIHRRHATATLATSRVEYARRIPLPMVDCAGARIIEKRMLDYRSSIRLRIHRTSGALWFDTWILIFMGNSFIVSYWFILNNDGRSSIARAEVMKHLFSFPQSYYWIYWKEQHNDHWRLLWFCFWHGLEWINLDRFDYQWRNPFSLFVPRHCFHLGSGSFLLHMVYYINVYYCASLYSVHCRRVCCDTQATSFCEFSTGTRSHQWKTSQGHRYTASSGRIHSQRNPVDLLLRICCFPLQNVHGQQSDSVNDTDVLVDRGSFSAWYHFFYRPWLVSGYTHTLFRPFTWYWSKK